MPEQVELSRNKEQMLQALESTGGLIKPALDLMQGKVKRTTHYYWLHTDSEYAARFQAIIDTDAEFALSRLKVFMRRDDQLGLSAIKFYLDRVGHRLGFRNTAVSAFIAYNQNRTAGNPAELSLDTLTEFSEQERTAALGLIERMLSQGAEDIEHEDISQPADRPKRKASVQQGAAKGASR